MADKQLALISEQPAAIGTTDRRGYIGSSDIAAIIGLSPFKTAYEVWEEKTTDTWEESDSPILRRGRRAEPFLLETLKSEFDVWVLEANRRTQHERYNFLRAESDFLYVINGEAIPPSAQVGAEPSYLYPMGYDVGENNVGHGEIKSVGFNRGEWGEANSQDVPAYYLAQSMFAMQINKLPEATIWGCFGFDDIRPYRFDFDAEAGQALEDAAVNFWNNHILPKVPPATKTAEDCRKVLARFQGFTWEATKEAMDSALELKNVKRSISLLKAEEEAKTKAFLDHLILAAEVYGIIPSETKNITVLAPGGAKFATWNEQHRKAYEVKETDFRVLRFAGGKKGEE
jgi:putative phage-type endonuclease